MCIRDRVCHGCLGLLESKIFYLEVLIIEAVAHEIDQIRYNCQMCIRDRVSGIVILVMTNRITRPISELTKLSEKMSDLDFDARYQSRACLLYTSLLLFKKMLFSAY